MTNRPTVYVTQEPWPNRETGEPMRDFTPAEEFGKLKFLLPSNYLPQDGDELINRLIDGGLDGYQKEDYLLLSGHPAAIGAAVAIATQFCSVNLLIWHGRTRAYNSITLDLNPGVS